MPSRKILKIQVLWGVIWCNLGAWINWQMPGFHIKQEIMEYLTNAASCGCGQKQQQRNDLTGDTLVANISEILVELMPKEIRNLDVRSFWPQKFANHRFYINGYVSVSMHQGIKVLRVALLSSWNVRTSSLSLDSCIQLMVVGLRGEFSYWRDGIFEFVWKLSVDKYNN